MNNTKKSQWEKLKGIKERIYEKLKRTGKNIKFKLHKHFPKRIWNNAQENRKGRKF